MNITTISLAMNIAIGITVWQSSLSILVKILLTVLLVCKFAIFFYTAWMSDGDGIRKAGAIGVIVLNVAIIIYTVLVKEYFIVIPTSVTLLLFAIWSFATIFDFNFRSKKE